MSTASFPLQPGVTMSPNNMRVLGLVACALLAAACRDQREPTGPEPVPSPQAGVQQVAVSAEQRAAWFRQVIPAVMALPRTVFADDDENSGILVFGVEHADVIAAIQGVLARYRVPPSAYRITVTEPIHFVIDLQDEHRPTLGGIQIVFRRGACTLGFNVTHADGPSFITTSHCSNRQGAIDGTDYYQPVRVVPPQFAEIVADEVDDPTYFTGGDCSPGKKCRYSDAGRALYRSGIAHQGAIARTSGANNGSIEVVGEFSITAQGDPTVTTLHKVGRTTGWTSGGVAGTCVTVNVLASNIQLLCQTLVQQANAVILGAGDSGAPVFQIVSGTNVRLVGILWGGNESGDTFVFSPFSAIQNELGALTATQP
jgi:hypothetical protein